MLAMLNEGESVNLSCKDKTYQVITLEKLLKDEIQENPQNKECQAILDNLPTFRAKWLEQWQQSKAKQDAMQRNYYLFARASLLHQKSAANITSSATTSSYYT